MILIPSIQEFAFYNNAENVNDNTEKYLDKFMEKTIKDTSFNYDFYKNIFVESINLINNLDDVNVFKTQKGLFIPSEYEAIMIGVAQNIEFYKQNKAILIEKVKELKQDTDFKTYSGTASNSTSRIKNRLKRVSEIFKNHP